MKSSESILGFGFQRNSSVGLGQSDRGKLRPKRAPLQPIRGISVELNFPSELRATSKRLSSIGSVVELPWALPDA